MSDALPFVDEYEANIEASPAAVFSAATRCMAGSFEGKGARAFSSLLGCENRGDSFAVPPIVGQELNGFRVARVDQPSALILEGEHRFATYRLSFLVDPAGEDSSRLRARTEAAFPGFKGMLYRALVIGSGAHRFIVRRMLKIIGRKAAFRAGR